MRNSRRQSKSSCHAERPFPNYIIALRRIISSLCRPLRPFYILIARSFCKGLHSDLCFLGSTGGGIVRGAPHLRGTGLPAVGIRSRAPHPHRRLPGHADLGAAAPQARRAEPASRGESPPLSLSVLIPSQLQNQIALKANSSQLNGEADCSIVCLALGFWLPGVCLPTLGTQCNPAMFEGVHY